MSRFNRKGKGVSKCYIPVKINSSNKIKPEILFRFVNLEKKIANPIVENLRDEIDAVKHRAKKSVQALKKQEKELNRQAKKFEYFTQRVKCREKFLKESKLTEIALLKEIDGWGEKNREQVEKMLVTRNQLKKAEEVNQHLVSVNSELLKREISLNTRIDALVKTAENHFLGRAPKIGSSRRPKTPATAPTKNG